MMVSAWMCIESRSKMKDKIVNGAAAILTLVGLIFSAGCVSDSVLDRKISQYRPNVDDRDVASWQAAADGEKPVDGNPGGVNPYPDKDPTLRPFWVTPIRRGDKVMIYLRGIPTPEEKPDIVDDRGEISLPFINKIKIEGMTTSEAENLIEQAYIKGGYYNSIAVTIVTQEDEYFIRGEVKRAGRYPLRPGMTLLQAISGASGYTEFSKPGKIQVIRDNKKLHYDAEKIEEGKEKDPGIKPGDIIIIGRRWFL